MTSIIRARIQNPERLAWGVMLIAFAVFCLICMLSMIAVHAFFFTSSVPMSVTVQAARGNLGLTGIDLRESTVRASAGFGVGNIVRPNPQSQALVTFRDPYDESRILAMITLDDSISAATLRSAVRPRFDWGNAGYEIVLEGVEGRLDVQTADGYGSNLGLRLLTTQGAEVRLIGSGQYQVRALEDTVRVVNLQGEVVLIDPQQPLDRSARLIPPGSQAITRTGAAEILVTERGQTELLQNSRFKERVGALPTNWRCSNEPGSAPSGNINTAFENGRQAVYMIRGDDASTHGETYCEQGALSEETPNWLDVSGFDYLALRATFYVNYQSLNRCGVEGSECPLMILLQYIDIHGNQRNLRYGFYAISDPTRDDPFTCADCRQEHIAVGEKTWYTFDTGNILSTVPEEQLPDYVTLVRIYVSGHQYDTRVSEVSLTGGHLDQISPELPLVEVDTVSN